MIVLRRTPFKRPAPPWPRRPERQWLGATPTSRAPAKAVSVPLRMVSPLPKEVAKRDEAYRRYVASHPCLACGIAGLSQAAHPNLGKGLSLKTDDRLCFPLCGPSPMRVGCHTQHDLCIDMTREQRRAAEALYVPRMQAQARADGWPL